MSFYYRPERVSDRMTAIHSLSGEILYLVHGADRAILIDTGLGVRGLRDCVTTLTDRPITAVVTHGHLDHAMGAPEFDDVYLNPLDSAVYAEMSPIELREDYIRLAFGPDATSVLEATSFVQPFPVSFKDLQDGAVFDAGGIHVDAYHLPGHTPGMTAVLVREERVLILGDGCNPRTFLFDHNSTSVEEYREALRILEARVEGRFDHVFVSHATMEVPVTIIGEGVELCGEIMAGRADDVPFDFMGHSAHLAKRSDERAMRLDGKSFNVVYDRSRVFGGQGDARWESSA